MAGIEPTGHSARIKSDSWSNAFLNVRQSATDVDSFVFHGGCHGSEHVLGGNAEVFVEHFKRRGGAEG